MEKFDRLTAPPAPLSLANVDTDMIIPARFMKALSRSGLGRHLIQELRYAADGAERGDFILNRGHCRHPRIFIDDRNIGSGSYRDTDVWGSDDFSVPCIVAPRFGDKISQNKN